MKHAIAIAGMAVAATLLAQPAAAQNAAPRRPVCLNVMQIRDTHAPNDRTILFHMDDGRTWVNHLKGSCPDLRVYGFSYDVTPDHRICGNIQAIRVLQTGSVCLLGRFELVPPHNPQGGEP